MSIMTDLYNVKASAAHVAQSLLPSNAKNVQSYASAPASTSSSDDGGTNDITSNDFLTLLVTEMKNQDPTQPTDPNAYIQQLVEVNSLQQLISINQGLSTIEGTSTTGTSTNATQPITTSL
jgi:flagellar basal-body rod modification protein FlgD